MTCLKKEPTLLTVKWWAATTPRIRVITNIIRGRTLFKSSASNLKKKKKITVTWLSGGLEKSSARESVFNCVLVISFISSGKSVDYKRRSDQMGEQQEAEILS